MTHVVVPDSFNCPKCGKKNYGASVQILDFLVCTDCFYNKFQKELEPKIFLMVREYFKYGATKEDLEVLERGDSP